MAPCRPAYLKRSWSSRSLVSTCAVRTQCWMPDLRLFAIGQTSFLACAQVLMCERPMTR